MKKRINFLLFFLVFFTVATLGATPIFREVCSEVVLNGGESSVVKGVDGWLFLKDELVHISSGKFWGADALRASRVKKKKIADPLPEIIQYNKLLADKGITLYLMPVPPKALVYPDKVTQGVDAASAEEDQGIYNQFFDVLNQNGVKTINLLPTLLKNREKVNLYCKTDTHFSGQGLNYFAKAAAAQIQREPWYKDIAKKEFATTKQEISIRGDLLQMSGEEGESEGLQLSVVSDKETGNQLESDPKSSVILLGDSHTLVFSAGGDLHAKGAGLFDHLSAQLGFAVDLLGVRGSGVTPARIKFYQRSKKDGDYLNGKKVLIWCFTAREFTGTGGWRAIPVAP